jgi:hypothetical protein
MSEFLHPGGHPDADRLNAFAEHVLPDHERLETLAHLAECPDCRQIVFLAQRAQETQAPLPQALPGRTGWWRNWHNLWPVGAALTCGLLVVVFLQRRHHVNLPQKSDVAFESSAPVAPSQLPQPIVQAPPPSGPPASPKSSTTAKMASSLHPAPATPRPEVVGMTSINGNLAMDQLKDNLSAFSRNAPAADQQSSAGSYSVGSAMGAPVAQALPPQEQKNSQLAVSQFQNQPLSQQATTARPSSEPSQSDIQRSATQTVAITNADPVLQTENAVVSASVFSLSKAQAKKAGSPLPSKRPAASTISNGPETLAVDSAGDLFLSKDAGMRWQRVTHQWTGKAIKVNLASRASMTQSAPSKTLSGGATTSTNFDTGPPAAVATRVGFELTTDTGAIWSSPDGLVWKRQ